MTYPGGKGNVYHKIINLIPPHEVYIECFLGRGYVMEAKLPAARNIGLDIDPAVIAAAHSIPFPGKVELLNTCALEFLSTYALGGRAFVYADPPYLMHTRSSQRDYYAHEFATEQEHRDLLRLLKSLSCMVAISGYASDLYFRELKGWHHVTWLSVTRSGRVATEYLWMNYDAPQELHDYRYLGDDFVDRQRIHRKIQRHVDKLLGLPVLERNAILAALRSL